MRAIFGRKAHVARRIIWIIILITCFGTAVVQVGNIFTILMYNIKEL